MDSRSLIYLFLAYDIIYCYVSVTDLSMILKFSSIIFATVNVFDNDI